MGKFNSSKTRVAPVFNKLLSQDSSGRSWLPVLLGLPGGKIPPDFSNCDFCIKRHGWVCNPAEIPLPPPMSLLRWLVQNVNNPQDPNVWRTSKYSQDKRQKLIARDAETIQEALKALEKRPQKAMWYVLEGDSYPDVYLETTDLIVVVEGKRTEGKPTQKTSWMSCRDQMWRHIDCAWDMREGKRVCGMLIVETPEEAVVFEKETRSASDQSLPHRSADEIRQITSCFLGATTWKTVCERCGIPWKSIEHLEA